MQNAGRRTVLKIIAGGSLVALSERAGAQTPPAVKIGLLTDMSGPLSTAVGPGSVLAARMAIEKFGQSHPNIVVELTAADMQNKTDLVLSIAREWIDSKEFDVITEVPNSAGALALGPLLTQRDKMGLFTSAQSTRLTGDGCGTNHTQWMGDSWANSQSAVEAQLRSGGRSWFFITGDTAFGNDLEATAANFVKAGGGTIVGTVKHPFPGTVDFSSYLVQAQASGANVVAMANSGNDLVNCIKQAAEFGIQQKGQRLAGLALGVLDIQAIGLASAQGVLLSESFYWDETDETRAFAAAFKANMSQLPTAQQACQYSALLAYLNAVAEIGVIDAKRSGRAVLAQMRSRPFQDPLFGTSTLREDGRVMRRMLVMQVKTPEESKSRDDILKINAVLPGDKAFRKLSDGGCPFVKA